VLFKKLNDIERIAPEHSTKLRFRSFAIDLFLLQWVNDVVVCKEDLEVTFHEHLTLWWLLGFLVLDHPTFISLQIDDEYTFSGPSQLP